MSGVEPVMSRYFHTKGAGLGLPVGGTFELTPRCNFNCRMCYVHLDKKEADERGKELTADEWLEIASIAKKRGLLFLLLTGGEPLVRPDFKYLYTELKKMGFVISINTNGSLIDGDYLDFFVKNPPSRFNISLYGASDDTYESLCGNRMFSKVIANIRAIKAAGIDVKLNVLFTPYNIQDMDKIGALAADIGIPIKPSAYLYPPVRVDENEKGHNAGRFTPEDAARYEFICDKNRFEPEMFRKRTEAICRGVRTECDEDCDGTPSEGISCRAGRSSFWMTWDGRMLPCGMMLEPVAYPLEVGFDDAWRQIREKAKEIRLPAECKNCSVRHACHVCAAAAYAETGKFDKKPQYICDMVHSLVDCYEKEYAATLKAEKEDASDES